MMLLLPTLASGKTRVSVVVFAQDVFSKRAAGFVEHYGAQRFLRESVYELVEFDELLLSGRPSRDAQDFQAAKAQLHKAMEAYENLDLDSAIKDLNAVVEKFEHLPVEVGRDRERSHVTALTYLGAALVLKGDPEKGQHVFHRLLAFERRAQLDKSVFPPSLVDTFEAVRSDVVSGPSNSLSVVSTPSSGRVYVNGIFKGVTPITVSAPPLPVGDHLVVVRSTGYIPCGRKAKVEEGEENSVNCKLAAVPVNDAFQNALADASKNLAEDEPLPQALRAYLKPDDLDQVVVGRLALRGQEIQYLLVLFDVASGKPVRAHNGAWKDDAGAIAQGVDGVISFLTTGREDMLKSAPVVTGGKTAVRFREEENFEQEHPPYYRTWWFWTAVGGGVAVAVTAIVLAVVLTQSSEPQSKILLEFF